MPTTVAVAAAAGGVLGGTGLVTFGFVVAGSAALTGALVYGGLAAASYVAQRAFGPRAPKIGSQDPSPQGQVRGTFRAERASARWVVGRARIGGWQYSMDEGADEGKYGFRALGYATALCETAYTEIEQIWLNGEPEPFSRVKDLVPLDGGHTGFTVYGAGETPPVDALFVPDGSTDGSGSEYRIKDAREPNSLNNQRWIIAPRSGVTGGLPEGGKNPVDPDTDAPLWDFDNLPVAPAREARGVGITFTRLWQPSPSRNEDNQVWTAPPQVELLVKGIKILWPQDNAGTLQAAPEWTDNCAAILWWFMTERMKIRPSRIDNASFRAAFAKCAEEVTVTGSADGYPRTYTRYTANGMISADDDHLGVIRELLFAMAGSLVKLDGRWHIYAGAERPAVKTLTDSDIIRTVEIRPAPALQDRINALTIGVAQSAEHGYTSFELPEIVDADGEARDGKRLPADLGTRAFVTNPVRAQMLARIELRRSRAQAVHVYQIKAGATMQNLAIAPKERLLVTDSESGLVAAKMEVIETRVLRDWSVELTLRHAPDGIYADDVVSMPAFVATPALPPRRIDRPADVTGLSAVGSAVFLGGSIRSAVSVSWTDRGYPVSLVIRGPGRFSERTVSLNIVGATGEHTFIVPGVGDYTVVARQVGSGGIESANSATATATVSWDDLEPGDVPSPEVTPFAILDEASRLQLTLGCTVTWGDTPFDVVLSLTGGSFGEEQIVETGQRIATFVVPRPGAYVMRMFLQHRPTGLRGSATTIQVPIRTTALRPEPAVVTAAPNAFVAADGAIVSTVRLSWQKTPDRARVVIMNAAGYRDEIDTIEESVDFVVPTNGRYSYSVTLFNGAETGAPAFGMVTVSWAHLAPTEAVVPVVFNAIAATAHMILQRPVDPSIDALSIRYKVKDTDDDTPLATITTEEQWTSSPRLGTFPIALGPLENNVIQDAEVQATGEYAMYGRWVNTHGLEGPISFIGSAVFLVPVGESGVAQLSGTWPGMLHNLAPHRDTTYGSVLVFDPGDPTLLTDGELNGKAGWPFGRREGWGMHLPTDDAREPPTALRARWRPGSGGLGASPVVPADFLADGVTGGFRIRDFNLVRTHTSAPVVATLRFREGGDGLSGGTSTTNPLFSTAVEQDASWQILYRTGTGTSRASTIIDLGGPDHDGTGAVRDSTNPYDWTPQAGAQAALATLMTALGAGTVNEIILRILHPSPAWYLSSVQDAGAQLSAAWDVDMPAAQGSASTDGTTREVTWAAAFGWQPSAPPAEWLSTTGETVSFLRIKHDPMGATAALRQPRVEVAMSALGFTREVADDTSWTLIAGAQRIDLGAPNATENASIRDTTNPYDWTPPSASHAALRTLIDNWTATPPVRPDLSIEVVLGAARGPDAANAWQVRAVVETVQPMRTPEEIAAGVPPAPVDDAAYTLQHSTDEVVWTSLPIEPNTYVIVPGARYFRLRIDVGDDWSGTGIALLQLAWIERTA